MSCQSHALNEDDNRIEAKYKCKKKTWKDEKTKNKLKREERSDIYQFNVCKVLRRIENLERMNKILKHSTNTVVFIGCRSRLTIVLAGAARG